MTQIKLEPRDDGVILHVRAKAGARKSGIECVHDGALKVSVTAAPEKGRANQAICELLARTLGVSKSRVTVISGETSPSKRILVQGRTPDEIQTALREATDH
jgi:uncharacterized protein (TIGR00251 family)